VGMLSVHGPLPAAGFALSAGERVDRDGAFTSRRGPGEGHLERVFGQGDWRRPSGRVLGPEAGEG
jgi:hypothetical protein